MKAGTVFFVVVGSVFFACGPMPLNPNAHPDYAKVTVTAINGKERIEPFGVVAGDSVSLLLHRFLPVFIDSITVSIVLTDGEGTAAWHIARGTDTTDITQKVVFPDEGMWRCIVCAHISNSKQYRDTLIFSVAPKKENHRPMIKEDPLPFYSDEGNTEWYDLAVYVNDSDSDSVVFTITPVPSGFSLTGSRLTASADLDAGVYRCTLTVSDGMLHDSATIIWRVLSAGRNDDTPDPDDTPSVSPDLADSSAISFVEPETLVIISEGSLKTIHYEASARDGGTATVSLVNSPLFVTGVVSGDGMTLTLAPGYATVTSGLSEVDSTITLMAYRGTDTVQLPIAVVVRNVNRPPEFTTFPPDTIHVESGNTYRSVPFSGEDPDDDALWFALITQVEGMSIASDRKIHWQVPASGFTGGQVVPVTVRITDGTAFADRSLFFVVD